MLNPTDSRQRKKKKQDGAGALSFNYWVTVGGAKDWDCESLCPLGGFFFPRGGGVNDRERRSRRRVEEEQRAELRPVESSQMSKYLCSLLALDEEGH